MAARDDGTWTRRNALAWLGLAGVGAVTGCRSVSRSAAAVPAAAVPAAAAPAAAAPVAAGTTAAVPAVTTATPAPTQHGSLQKVAYGTDSSQYGDLSLPPGEGMLPVAVVVHGGYWGSAYGHDLGAPIARDLVQHGVAVWNIEYRRIGNGGGWPGTFLDVADAMDALAGKVNTAAGNRLDLANVVVVGHSAGGQLAGWLAARHKLARGAVGASPKVSPVGYVAQAGVLDLVGAFADHLGGGAVTALMGGSPAKYPERYAVGSPYALLPFAIPGTLVHGLDDGNVPIVQSDTFAAKAKRLGDRVSEVRLPGVDHFMLIDPYTPAWGACRKAALGYLSVSRP